MNEPPGARLYALLGDPVEHSFSPRLHRAAFRALGIPADYVLRRVTAEQLPNAMRELASAGGGGNVTLPHKALAARSVDFASEDVRRTGACNTFWSGPRGLHGDNTDVQGFLAAVAHHGVRLAGARVLLLGAGGAAAAVLAALAGTDARVLVVNRNLERARRLVQHLRPDVAAGAAAAVPGEPFDVVINATSLGLRPADPAPLAVDALPAGCVVLDLVYGAGGTPLTRAAQARGLLAFEGTEMLLRQAALSFRLWTGREAPLAAMRSALAGA